MRVPVLGAKQVYAAVTPEQAVEAVRAAFINYFRGEWSMPPKVYVPAYPAGDFRAMPALGAGHALLKWVTSFPGNPGQGLPTVMGVVLLSDASNGMPVAVLDAGAVTALRTGAAAVLAAETLGRTDGPAAIVGAGINGVATARTFLARGREILIWDVDENRARSAAEELRGRAAGRDEALSAQVVATVTPAREAIFTEASLQSGQHVSLMGADGPGKAEIAVEELARVHVFCDDWVQASPSRTRHAERPRFRVFCDDWIQASHNGDLAHAVHAAVIGQEDVTELGAVLAGEAPGRRSDRDITVFDSTGLAIQDLAVALAAMERADELDLPSVEL